MAGLFEVNGATCVKCGACVRDCAFRALKMEGGVPRMAFPDRCMKCQHCLAVCPTGAVTFDGKRAADSVPVAGLPLPSLDAVENWLRTTPFYAMLFGRPAVRYTLRARRPARLLRPHRLP